MFRYILKRIFLILISLMVIVIITFFLMNLMPGVPTALVKIQEHGTTHHGPGQNEILLAYLNKPVLIRFADFIKGLFIGKHIVAVQVKGVTHNITLGRFGYIFENIGLDRTDLSGYFFKYFKYTIAIAFPAFVISTLVGVSLGFIAGYHRGKWLDTFINIFVMLFIAVPSFVLAIIFMVLGKIGGLPTSFKDNLGTAYLIKSSLLPMSVLALGGIASLTYYTRNEVVEILKTDYVSIARAKGLSEMQILRKHIFRNASIPLVSIILPSFIGILSGSFVIEIFFGIPGTSKTVVNAVAGKEIYIIEFSIIFFGSLSLLVSLLVDISYVFIDPRIKIASSNNMSIYRRFKLAVLRKKTYKNEIKKAGDK